MKVFNLITIAVVILWVSACKKDPVKTPEEPREPEAIIGSLVDDLETADTLSVFVEALKELTLSADEVEEGITVFAPLDDEEAQPQQALVMGTRASIQALNNEDLTPTVLKDHIVKGVLTLDDLTDGRILISLSGKELKASRIGNKIWLNGIQIGSEVAKATEGRVVYSVKALLSGTTVEDELQTTSLEVSVWDATAWGPGNPRGVPAESGTVWLYATQEDYANDVAAYEQVIENGKAVFSDIRPGRYYIKAEYGDKGNIFYQSRDGNLYYGMAAVGIFQTEAEISDSPAQPDAALGNFRWQDSNGDGIINNSDKIALPFEHAQVRDGSVRALDVMVGYEDNTAHKPLTQDQLAAALLAVQDDLGAWQRNLSVVDAVLSGEVARESLSPALANQFGSLGDFSFTPNHPAIYQLWQGGYSIIDALTKLESRALQPASLGTLRLIRAYVYLQLMQYFGNIPLATAGAGNLSNSDLSQVYKVIENELKRAADELPLQANGGPSKGAAQALLARLAMIVLDVNAAANFTGQIIGSGVYNLAADASEIFKAGSPEILWDRSSSMQGDIKQFFFNRSIFPFIRYTEVLLIAADASARIGELTEAQMLYNMVASRSGAPLIAEPLTTAEFLERLMDFWGSEMPREGHRFVNLVRWGKAAEALAARGYVQNKSHVLPIPQVIIDNHPEMVQNSGY